MDLERIKITLDMMAERAKSPLSNPLEVGFRHSPLSNAEMLKRYKEFSEEILVDCETILKEICNG